MQQSIDIQYDIDGGGKVRSRSATTVEHAGGGDRGSEPSMERAIGDDRRSKPVDGAGWGYRTRLGKKKGGAYSDQVEQIDGINRRSRPTEDTDIASQLMGRGGEKARWMSRGQGGDKARLST